jgi:hypothetical protein
MGFSWLLPFVSLIVLSSTLGDGVLFSCVLCDGKEKDEPCALERKRMQSDLVQISFQICNQVSHSNLQPDVLIVVGLRS